MAIPPTSNVPVTPDPPNPHANPDAFPVIPPSLPPPLPQPQLTLTSAAMQPPIRPPPPPTPLKVSSRLVAGPRNWLDPDPCPDTAHYRHNTTPTSRPVPKPQADKGSQLRPDLGPGPRT